MEIIKDTVKEKLILQGITELETYGINGFSLRRVASSCAVSCAAPYKHFKNKDEFIFEIAKYIFTQWNLFTTQILSIIENDTKKQITEICISYIRFWLANPKFRSVLMINTDETFGKRADEIAELSQVTKKIISDYCKENSITKEKQNNLIFSVRAITYGAIMMMNKGELENSPESLNMIKETLIKQLSI